MRQNKQETGSVKSNHSIVRMPAVPDGPNRTGRKRRLHDIEEVLCAHAARYPEMQPQDAVKLVHQNEFGGGHLIPDASASLAYLEEEMACVEPDGTAPLLEDIGNGRCRLHLRAARAGGCSPALVNRLFVASANHACGSPPSMRRKLDALRALAEKGLMPFSPQSLQDYLHAYDTARCPAVRHSEAYRKACRPAYRVVSKSYATYLRLFAAIEGLLSEKRAVVAGIDGMCGSGKTTLAGLLGDVYGCGVISMDDFFLPPALRTAERLNEPGGNIHYERFLEEVVAGLRSGSPIQYRVYDCARGDYDGVPKTIRPAALTVIEGSYSLHPLFAGASDLRVFLSCPPQDQRRRLLERSGPAMLVRFMEEWIPMENRYFAAFGIPESCHLRFQT